MAAKPVRLVLLGRQGAGKGTQCVRISHALAIPHISTGDMLRAAAKSGTPFGLEAKSYMDSGKLLPDEVILGVVSERLREPDARLRGFVLDGFPRTDAQARSLDGIVAPDGLSAVINLEVARELVLSRIASRRVCVVCGANYSVNAPPKEDWSCDLCGGEVLQREDDEEEAVTRRLDLYESTTLPLLSYYGESGLLETVDGVGDPDEVMGRIMDVLIGRGVLEDQR